MKDNSEKWMAEYEDYRFRAVGVSDPEEKAQILRMACSSGREAGAPQSGLFSCHVDYFRAQASNAESEFDMCFQVDEFEWITETGSVEHFVVVLADEFPVILWHILYEGWDHISEGCKTRHGEDIARCMVFCLNKTEAQGSSLHDWKFIGVGRNKLQYSYTGDRFSSVGMPKEAALMYITSALRCESQSDLERAIKAFDEAGRPSEKVEAKRILSEWKAKGEDDPKVKADLKRFLSQHRSTELSIPGV